MARERIALECGRKNIGLSRITKDEETQTSNKELNKLVAQTSHTFWDSEVFYAGVFRALSRIPSHEHVTKISESLGKRLDMALLTFKQVFV